MMEIFLFFPYPVKHVEIEIFHLELLIITTRLWKQCQTLFFGAPKSLQMVTAAMKLKDAYSMEGKL